MQRIEQHRRERAQEEEERRQARSQELAEQRGESCSTAAEKRRRDHDGHDDPGSPGEARHRRGAGPPSVESWSRASSSGPTGQGTSPQEPSQHSGVGGVDTGNEPPRGVQVPGPQNGPQSTSASSQRHPGETEADWIILVKTFNDAVRPVPSCPWAQYTKGYRLPDHATVGDVKQVLRIQHEIGQAWRMTVQKDGVECQSEKTLGALFQPTVLVPLLHCRLTHIETTKADAASRSLE